MTEQQTRPPQTPATERILTPAEAAERGWRISNEAGEAALVSTLSSAMRSKLDANRGKRHWLECSPDFLLGRLHAEVEELEQAIGGYLEEGSADEDDVWAEAADVANFAAMLADNATGRAEPRTEVPQDNPDWDAGFLAGYEQGRDDAETGRAAQDDGLDAERLARALREMPSIVGPMVHGIVQTATAARLAEDATQARCFVLANEIAVRYRLAAAPIHDPAEQPDP